jgi:phage shock protein PspC (stress-responsive transcriptional regulator)
MGLCGGIAEFLQVDPTLVRVGVVILTICSSGSLILLYFLLSLIVPKEPVFERAPGMDWEMSDQPVDDLDKEIDRIEKRALQQEVYRLREKLAKMRDV